MLHMSGASFSALNCCCFVLGGSGIGGSADGACLADDVECAEHDRLGMEAIRSLHQQLDDDDNGNIDLTESDDVSNQPFLSNFLTFFRSIFESDLKKRVRAFEMCVLCTGEIVQLPLTFNRGTLK